MEISFANRVVVAPDTLINVVGEEAVLLNLKNEQYYGLDVMGTEMWQVLTASGSISEAYEKLLGEYDVSAEVLQKDLNDLLVKLLSNGLVELQGE
ncbi:MAG: PqqD family protein [Acidobacteria bacterium]|nr:PqqD family protein [Acidobacteriota bacterium]